MDADLLPARMVNEYVYCPRLFFLEWVEARFADNDDTRLGQQVHRKVDTEAGAAPLPEDGELRRARSITLSSERLGVIAKLDLVEGDGGSVVPVDYKKGSPQPDGSPWPSDEVQVCLQALLLRERGYRCEHAELWYAETRQRVRVELTPQRLSWAADLVADARGVADRARPPLPLVDSPKCLRCSLVGLCLPDETNALLARREQPPRRLVPRDPDQRPVYVTEPGTFVGVRSGRLEVTLKKEKLALVPPARRGAAGGVRAGADQHSGAGGVLRARDSGAVVQRRRVAAGVRRRATVQVRGTAAAADGRARAGGCGAGPADDRREDPELPDAAAAQCAR